MEIAKVKLGGLEGLHMRPAARIVHLAKEWKAKIMMCCNNKSADSCSILELLALGASKGDEIAVIAQGPDEKEAIAKISELFESGGGI
jgi:phosphotransferase system HPr (HPr) family protein